MAHDVHETNVKHDHVQPDKKSTHTDQRNDETSKTHGKDTYRLTCDDSLEEYNKKYLFERKQHIIQSYKSNRQYIQNQKIHNHACFVITFETVNRLQWCWKWKQLISNASDPTYVPFEEFKSSM